MRDTIQIRNLEIDTVLNCEYILYSPFTLEIHCCAACWLLFAPKLQEVENLVYRKHNARKGTKYIYSSK